MKGKMLYLAVVAATIYLNLMYDWGTGSYILAVEMIAGVVCLLQMCFMGNKLEVSFPVPHMTMQCKEEGNIDLQVKNHSLFPAAGAVINLVCYYHGSRRKEKMQVRMSVRGRKSVSMKCGITPAYCGKLEIAVKSVKVSDYIGLFSRTRRGGEIAEALVLPRIYDIPVEISRATRMSTLDETEFDPHRSGDDPSEIYRIREYQPGDRPTQIHWKLTSKSEEIKVKEYSRPVGASVAVLLEGKGRLKTADMGNDFIELAASLSHKLYDEKCVHDILWAEKKRELMKVRVQDEESFHGFLTVFLESAASEFECNIMERYEECLRPESYGAVLTVSDDGEIKVNGETAVKIQLKDMREALQRELLEI